MKGHDVYDLRSVGRSHHQGEVVSSCVGGIPQNAGHQLELELEVKSLDWRVGRPAYATPDFESVVTPRL